MAGLCRCPQRFTHEEWTYSNNLKYRSAEKEREISQGLQSECDRFMDESAKRTERTSKDVDKKIEQRIKDIKYWKSEVNKKLQDVTDETGKLNDYYIRLKKALEATEEPLHITQQCLLTREGRTGIDLVHDDAQKELYKELEVYKGVQALLQKTIEQTKEQLRLNRKTIYNLKKDATDKLKAQNIDEYALSLKATDDTLPGFSGPVGIDTRSVSNEEWQAFSTASIEEGDRQLANSHELRTLIDGILQQVSSDQKRQFAATNRALNKRISETRSAKGKLEEHLAAAMKEISNCEDVITDVNKAIEDKGGVLKLTGTRIDLRKERPNVELCRDPASYRLIQEVDEITSDVAQLNHRLKLACESLKALCRRQLDLEEEIQIKASTIFIDDVQVKGMRESILITSF
ncbi:Tektin-1 [Fasciolopsis buskii]|uniref:Tektin n=1 Tax=Fasciolopsis buskii TaxID=27845 RepID=A0A8E0RKG8_9TREM|nr:Tektin-1 [Fasciolopsis buski]